MPKGLVRYSNQDSVGNQTASIWRPRLVIYPIALSITLSLFTYVFLTKKDFDAKLLRTLGNTFSVSESGMIDDTLRLSLTNRTTEDRIYKLSVVSPAGGAVRTIEPGETRLVGGEHRYVPILISAKFSEFKDGRCPIRLKIEDNDGEQRIIDYILLGPYQDPSK
jgi:polyferredoxin